MSDLFWLSDDAWKAIEPHLPKNQPGARRVDDRRVISGILHVLKVGCRWRGVPPEYGPAKTVYNRYHRWALRPGGDGFPARSSQTGCHRWRATAGHNVDSCAEGCMKPCAT